MPRVFEVICDKYHPTTNQLLMDEDKVVEALSHKTIKEYAYVLHDKDNWTYDDEDKAIDRLKALYDDGCVEAVGLTQQEFIDKKLTIKANDHKPDHWHVVIRTDRNCDASMIASWFDVPVNFIQLPKGHGAFMDKVEYLTHEREEQQALGKHFYSDDEIIANFDFRTEVNSRANNRLKYGAKIDNLTDGEELQLHVMQDGWSMRKCRQEDPLAYMKVRNKLPNLRLDYLLDQPPQPFRISIYVDGPGGIGKGSICQYIGERLFPNHEHPVFVVGNDPRVAFDGYDGEPVLIWEDYRAYKFIQNFSREGTFAIFDSHPKVQSQQVKNSRIVLQNYVNIVNGVEPYADFLDGLAGEYTDRDGNEHIAEDKNQVYRRFQQIICIRENEFDILFNKGFIDRDSSLYKQYDMYARVTGSMSQAMQRLEGAAKEHVLLDMSQPAINCYRMLESVHEDKISAIEDIPDEFKDYGKVKTGEEVRLEEEKRHREEAARLSEINNRMISEYCKFTKLWEQIYSDDLLAGTKNIGDEPSFERWIDMGCPDAFDDNKRIFFRSDIVEVVG